MTTGPAGRPPPFPLHPLRNMVWTIMAEPTIDFSHSFGHPHRMTVALPDSSDKTLIDVHKDKLGLLWTYGNLLSTPPLAYMPLRANWSASLWAEIDGRRVPVGSYARAEGFLPVLTCELKDPAGVVRMEIAGGATAAIIHIKVWNTDDRIHRFDVAVTAETTHSEVPGYIIEGDPLDHMLAAYAERADRVLFVAMGGECPLRRDTTGSTLGMRWDVKAGQGAEGWLIRPYAAYEGDVPRLRRHNWAREAVNAAAAWRMLLGRAVDVKIPDAGIRNAYYACLADMFVMREPVAGGGVAGTPGTDVYRCPNAGEPLVSCIALDQAGLHEEAEAGSRMPLAQQAEDGNWAEPWGWGRRCWLASGFRCWTIMEHYRLTGDRAYLETWYPRMLACARFQQRQRATTRVGADGAPAAGGSPQPLTWGLMPRGVGDCGLDAGDGLYGVFYPHNVWAVYADRLTLEAAEILGKKRDVPALKEICGQASDDLLASLEAGCIQEDGYRWIPGSPSCTRGSRWGVLNAAFPCGLLPPDHDLISGTLRYMGRQMSPGGLHVHTGWMADGMWVAISLDNVAEVELRRGNTDEFVRLLYACLNHGTPLYSWSEERAQEPGTERIAGDRQHLWTPMAVVRAIRDGLVMEEAGGLHLGRGAARHWLAGGEAVGITKAPTHFGAVSYEMRYEPQAARVTGSVAFPSRKDLEWAVLHIRLPGDRKVKSVAPETGASLLPDRMGIRWERPRGTIALNVEVG
jgi:hypothetical protein